MTIFGPKEFPTCPTWPQIMDMLNSDDFAMQQRASQNVLDILDQVEVLMNSLESMTRCRSCARKNILALLVLYASVDLSLEELQNELTAAWKDANNSILQAKEDLEKQQNKN